MTSSMLDDSRKNRQHHDKTVKKCDNLETDHKKHVRLERDGRIAVYSADFCAFRPRSRASVQATSTFRVRNRRQFSAVTVRL